VAGDPKAKLTPATTDGRAVSVRLMRVTRGDESIYDREMDGGDTAVAVAKNGGGLSFLHSASFTECYEPRLDGIEQTFVFDTQPDGSGDLRFECAVELANLTPLPPRAGRNGGILFADATGHAAAKYGQVMVRDAANKGLVVEPVFDAAAGTIAFNVPGVWVQHARYPLVVDPLVGDEFVVSIPQTNPNFVEQPSVCAGNGNFLIAWNDYSAGVNLPQLYGAVATTNSLTNPFAISNDVGLPLPWRYQRIEIAYDGTYWLVVWSDDRITNPGIHGALIAPNGTIFGGTDFLIATTTGNVLEDPLVTYNGTNFMVAWSDTPPSQTNGVQIRYAFLAYGNNQVTVGTQRVVPAKAAPIFQALEYVAAQPGNDLLILYQDLTETPALHRSVRVQGTGLLRDPGGTAMFFEDFVLEDGTQGYGAPIGAVFNNNEWQILSSFDQTKDSAVYLHRMSTAGVVTPPTGVFTSMGLGYTGLQRSGFDERYAPAFPGASEWLFLRTEKVSNNLYHIIGKRVGFDGTDNDHIPFTVDLSTVRGITRNAVAAQGGSQFLVAWLDGNAAQGTPGDRASINAAFVDATAANPDNGLPALVAVATASPTSGDPGMTVSFDLSNSQGTWLTKRWDFGDGSAAVTNLDTPSHIYKTPGTYIARLTLSNGAYSVYDTVVITVGMGGPVNVGMPQPTTGTIVSGMQATSAIVKLDFFNLNNDKATVGGVLDVSALPSSLVGTTATITLGSTNFVFPLDAKGAYKTDSTERVQINFAVDPVKNTFLFQLANANLRADMASLGMINDKVPNTPVNLPFAIKIENSHVTCQGAAVLGTLYHAAKNVSGTATYAFKGTGSEVSGTFLVTSFVATEGVQKHTFTIKGLLVRPGAYKPSLLGNFNVYLGDYHATIPGGSVLTKGVTLSYTQKKIVSGVKTMTVNTTTGVFLLQMIGIPADALNGGTGLPLAKSGDGISKVNLNLSFVFDLNGGDTLSAGRYVNISRVNSNAKSWKLR
jgi:PKD repeat protein